MKIVHRRLSSLKPYERNPRVNAKAVDAVARSIEAFGFRSPIVVDRESVIVCGHTRWKAAQQLGLKTVPVHIARDLTPEQLRTFRIVDNSTADLAEWDAELLPLELADLRSLGVDLDLLGFSDADLSKWLGGQPQKGLTDPDDVPDVPEEPVTKLGDLWLLGEHRLLCGDSTNPSSIERVLDGKKARMMFTDPPWNVAIGLDSNPRHRQREGLKNDDLAPEEFQAFLDGFITAVSPHVEGDIYCVLGASEWPRLDASLRSHGYHWSATVIWAKDSFVLGRSKYHRRYEPIWFGWHSRGKSSFQGRRDLDDVWEVPRPKRSEEHPTMKPVELVARAVVNSSRAGDLVFDAFGGSGSTLIACEQHGRKAALVEIDPGYCDVIVRRWEGFTGGKAERLECPGALNAGAARAS